MYDLTGFQRDLIYTISGTEEPYGLAIKEALQQYRNEEVNHGRLYPNLDTLVEKGYVEKRAKDRRTNLYTLTESARTAVNERRIWEDSQLAD
ncbi:PadR family transcriptional regulator [Halohasta litchfieldiae]|uniref:Transcriptional regulator PadR-like family protein n=1 Tax=Halohasta litchfieldiae TaxID=1073996 RepID=A0A1H6TVV1_9EURY|nr:helix-turn-helix transcriptional regulator [Halohasta litchfieldiae]ATW87167.1 PadR family transcriptional regulator [Halohasta litchfieldiae]SEI84188.1 Transcriptional regulator PadR-like family protein [Halohasta litchfieldiae]